MRYNMFEGCSEQEVKRVLNNIKDNLQRLVFFKNKHILFRHVDCTDEYLQERILIENLHSATSFYSLKEAKESILEAINYYWETEIQEFLMSRTDRWVLTFDTKKSIGYGYIKEVDGVFEDCHVVHVVLQKDDDYDLGFYPLTIYPIITRDLVVDTSVY